MNLFSGTHELKATRESMGCDKSLLMKCFVVCFQAQIVFDEISIALSDDAVESPSDLDEYVRLTLDCLAVGLRPRTCFNKPLRSLANGLPQYSDYTISCLDLQVDNQMYRKGLFDFPTVLTSGTGHLQPSQRPRLNLNSTAFDSTFEGLKKKSLLVIKFSVDISLPQHHVIKTIHIKCLPTKAYIEDRFVFKMSEVFESLASHLSAAEVTTGDASDSGESIHLLPRDVLMSANNLNNHMQLDSLEMEPLSVLVSVHASLKMFIGVDQSPLNFGPFSRKSLMTTNYALGQSLARFDN